MHRCGSDGDGARSLLPAAEGEVRHQKDQPGKVEHIDG